VNFFPSRSQIGFQKERSRKKRTDDPNTKKGTKKSRRTFCFQKKSGRDFDFRYEVGASFFESRSFFSANFFSSWSFSLVSLGFGSAASCGSSLDVNHSGNFSCRPM